jgi:uncharacterized RDD family membrane protein YckC
MAAAGYDLLVIGGVLMTSSFGVIIARGGVAVPAENLAFRIFLLAQVAAFFIFFWCRGGQTPGMRAWALRVEMNDGRPVTVNVAALRLVGALISAALLGLGFLWILFDPQKRGWHDRLSSTRVLWTKPR